MSHWEYSLDQIKERCYNYDTICNLFFELVKDNETKNKLEQILYNGKYKDFYFKSSVCNKDNPHIEAQRRISMAYLLIKNPETFEILVNEKINLFHGTNANSLPSILKYGLNSGVESEKQGLEITTGEKWSRIGGKHRTFVSLTDVLDISYDYASLGNNDLSFEVVIGTTVEYAKKNDIVTVGSDIPEVGIKNKLPIENIKIIGVPSDKVEYVKKVLNSDNIKVVAMDGILDRFYYIDEGIINISYDAFHKTKEGIEENKKGLIFKLDELKEFLIRRLLLNAKNIKNTNYSDVEEITNGKTY